MSYYYKIELDKATYNLGVAYVGACDFYHELLDCDVVNPDEWDAHDALVEKARVDMLAASDAWWDATNLPVPTWDMLGDSAWDDERRETEIQAYAWERYIAE